MASTTKLTGSLATDVGAAEVKERLRKMNQAQSLEANVAELKAAGGVDALMKPSFIHTDAQRGIELATIRRRQEVWGANVIPSTPRKSFFELFAETFDDATLQILIVAAVVSLAVGLYDDPATGYVEGCAILAAVLVVSVVTAANDYQKESQFRELSSVHDSDKDVVVVRGGLHWQIPTSEIVVGDVVCVEAGDELPCDGILIQSDGLQVDESALTGEPIDIYKDADLTLDGGDPFVLSGCTVESGTGKFIAIAVGKDSQWGIIQSKLEKEQEETPLQSKLDDMAALIGYVGMAAAAATFVAMMLIKVVLKPSYLEHYSIFGYALEAFIMAVTIVVVAVPEGLPLAVTISLAFSTKKMLADQNLIRHLAACETMGNATNICSDKTGTLTENRMKVVKCVFADLRCEDCIRRVPSLIGRKALDNILNTIACCSTARIVASDASNAAAAAAEDGAVDADEGGDDAMTVTSVDGAVLDARPQIVGNKTEAALLLLAQSEWGYHDDTDKRREAAKFSQPNGGSRLFPFSSRRKRMSVLVNKDPESTANPKYSEWTLYHKGAAEVVLANCSKYLDIDGTEKPMTKEKRSEFEQVVREFAADALRCVALAHRSNIQNIVDPTRCTAQDCERRLESRDMCLDGIAGIMDPLRKDVIDAVATCQRAGIFVRMVTGDNIDTAKCIAKQAGILYGGKCDDFAAKC